MATFKSYITGFILSLILTLAAYFAVASRLVGGNTLVTVILIFAAIQLIVQLIFFLHLFQEKGPRWNLVMFISTLGIVFLIVVGSIWIVNHLNSDMSPQQMNQYIQDQSTF